MWLVQVHWGRGMGCRAIHFSWVLVGWEWLRELLGGRSDHGNMRRTGAVGNTQGSAAPIPAVSARAFHRMPLSLSPSLRCPCDRMIDLLYLQMGGSSEKGWMSATRGFALLDNLARHPKFIPRETQPVREKEGLQPEKRGR